jgi:cytochrome c biogenesis protein CcdA
VIDAPLGYAITVGIASAFNPCGLPMLPAYLSYFLGVEAVDGAEDGRASLRRALVVGLTVSAGVAVTFAVAGLVINNVTRSVQSWIPWITIFIGIGLVGFGIALLCGFEPAVALPKLDRGGRTRGLGSMFVYGVSYAVASLGCTVQFFISLVALQFSERSLLDGIATFLAFAAGMALVLMTLTLLLALGQRSLVRSMRRALPYVQRVAGALLVPIGLYLVYYGWAERDVQSTVQGGAVIDRVSGWSSRIESWIQETGGLRIALVLGLVIAGAAAIAIRRRTVARARSRV